MTETYYRITEKRYEIGSLLKGRGIAPLTLLSPIIEDLLEKGRPKACIARSKCVYMRKERDFSTMGITFDNGYVHVIEPIGTVESRDTWWVGVLQKRYHTNARIKNDLCPNIADEVIVENYWGGIESDTPSLEWIAVEAKVIEVDEELSPVRPNSPLLDLFSGKT